MFWFRRVVAELARLSKHAFVLECALLFALMALALAALAGH